MNLSIYREEGSSLVVSVYFEYVENGLAPRIEVSDTRHSTTIPYRQEGISNYLNGVSGKSFFKRSISSELETKIVKGLQGFVISENDLYKYIGPKG